MTLCHRKHSTSSVPGHDVEQPTWESLFWVSSPNTHSSLPRIISLSVSLHSPWPLSVYTAYVLVCTQTPGWSNRSSSLHERIWSQMRRQYAPRPVQCTGQFTSPTTSSFLALHWRGPQEQCISGSSYTFFATPKFSIGQTHQLYASIHLQTKKSGLDAGSEIMSLNMTLEVPLRNCLPFRFPLYQCWGHQFKSYERFWSSVLQSP